MVVGDMQNTGGHPVVIAADKIKIGLCRHIGGRHRQIFIAGNIHPTAVIHLIIGARGDGKGRAVPLYL